MNLTATKRVNALQLLGQGVHPAYIIRAIETRNGAIVEGLLGISPEAIETAFQELNYNITSEYLPENLDASIKASHVSVLSFVHERGAHYVAVQYIDGVYKIYNPSNDSTKPEECDSIETWIVKWNFLPLSLVTIPKDTNKIKAPPIYTGTI